MSGLTKPKQYDWKDSNLALFGSDTEKNLKKDAAKSEPAWKGVGKEVGLKIWRIVNFKVVEWPKEDYGKFFSGDSYIILNTYKPDPKSDELAYDAHFWIGSKSSQDEYATAAYKTVELDMYLDDMAVQYREVQGEESERFAALFKSIIIMEGGAESGFRHVKPEAYKPRLLHFSGLKQHITIKEVPLSKKRLNSDDVFILDLGKTIYQWNGTGGNKNEKFKAAQFLNSLKQERGQVKTEVLEEETLYPEHAFYAALTEEDVADVKEGGEKGVKDLFRVSDAGGKLEMKKLKSGKISKNDFDKNDVFILDCGTTCFVWIGKGASASEKQNGMGYAHNHLMKTNHKLIPVVVIKDGQHSADFEAAIAA